jgi:hypothetical protein
VVKAFGVLVWRRTPEAVLYRNHIIPLLKMLKMLIEAPSYCHCIPGGSDARITRRYITS